MLLNYNHLYYFHAAAVEGSVAGAAQRLGVRQPTVSEQIRALERALGTNLFERTQTGLRLTEPGRLAFLQTCRMFRVGEQMTRLVGQAPAYEMRLLRIGISGGMARTTHVDFLLPLLALGEYVPNTRTADTVELVRELRTGLLDLVICETEPPEDMRRGLQLEVIDRTRLIAVAPASVQPEADWNNVGLATFRPTSPYWWEVAAYLNQHGLRPPIVTEADDALFLVRVATHMSCIAIVPESAARHALGDGSLKRIAALDSRDLAIHALYHDNTVARRAIALMVNAHHDSPT